MVSIRLQYKNGQFIPLEEIHSLNDGDEIEVQWTPSEKQRDNIDAILERTAGLWADIDGIEEIMNAARKQWDEEWQQRLNSL